MLKPPLISAFAPSTVFQTLQAADFPTNRQAIAFQLAAGNAALFQAERHPSFQEPNWPDDNDPDNNDADWIQEFAQVQTHREKSDKTRMSRHALDSVFSGLDVCDF